MKSTDINNQLDKCKSDLLHSMKALVEQKEVGDKSERNYHAELARAATLAADLSDSQGKILMIKQEHHTHNVERSEEAKKGAYIINVLTSELKISRGKMAEMDRVQDDLQKSNDDLRASLTKARELVSRSDRNVATVHNPDCIISNTSTNTVIRAAVAGNNDTNATATYEVSQQLKIFEQELLLLRKEKKAWQDERLVLLKKGDPLSLQNQALSELMKDLDTLKVEEDDASGELNLKYLPPPPPSVGIPPNQGGDNSYSRTYSRARKTSIPNYMGSTRSRSPPRHHAKFSVAQTSIPLGSCADNLKTGSNQKLEFEEIQCCPMTSRHHKWINLPSLRIVSTLLHENITKVVNDLQCSELKCLEVERKLKNSHLEIDLLKTEHKNETLKYIAATKISEREIADVKTDLSKRERDLNRGLEVHEILDKITVAFLSAPGGYGIFSNDIDESEFLDFKDGNDSKAVSNKLRDSKFYCTQLLNHFHL